MRWRQACPVLLALVCAACSATSVPVELDEGEESAMPPLEISYLPFAGSFTLGAQAEGEPSCGLPPGRQHPYDPKTGLFHVHLKFKNMARSAFEIKKAERFARPVRLRVTGATRGIGCLGQDLTLSVDGKDYALEEGALSYGQHVDKSLFLVKRDADAVTIEFTKKGETLLKPGTQIWVRFDTGW